MERYSSKSIRPVEFFPITTQGKIALDLWREGKKKHESREKPVGGEKAKSGTLPPPGEITDIDECLQLKTVPPPTSQKRYKRVPITTQEKIFAAKAKERIRGNKHGQDCKPTRRRVKIAGLAGQLQELEMLSLPQPPPDPDHPGVMFRKTMISKRWAELHPTEESITETQANMVCFLLRLPRSIREQIWTLAVVDTSAFVWPESPFGQEQPDLAMTSKEIRREVLPLFYGLNTFGVVLSPPMLHRRTGSRRDLPSRLSGTAALRKWATAIESSSHEDEKWLRRITHWAFEYTDPRSVSLERTASCNAQPRRFVVMVHFPASEGRAVWRAPEIHQEAACVLPGWRECGQCSPGKGKPVAQLEKVIKTAQQYARAAGGVNVEMVTRLAEQLRNWRDLLDDAKCRRPHLTS